MVVDDLETEHARFEKEQLAPGPLRDFKHDGKTLARFFFVADPDGYKIEVRSRKADASADQITKNNIH